MVELVRRLGWSYVSTVAAEVNNPVNPNIRWKHTWVYFDLYLLYTYIENSLPSKTILFKYFHDKDNLEILFFSHFA